MAVNTADIKFGAGTIYVAEYDATVAADLDDATKATAALATMTSIGSTTDATSLELAKEMKDVTRQQVRGPVFKRKTSESATLSATMGELNLENMQIAFGGGAIVTNADGSRTFKPGAEKEFTVVWVAHDIDETDGDIFVLPKCVVESGIKIEQSAEDEATLPVTFTGLESGVAPLYMYHEPA